ncbi:hypothetical protein [Coleofasciculus sp.]|uniref:hypothetical protein n=1 Tax=Coleofasciculus sp. TaxID=3100458 RepID=UPI0039F7D06B
MTDEDQTRVEHFAILKSKYQASDYEDSSPASLLYFILRKADLGIQLAEIEAIWLIERNLFETIKAIRKQQIQRKQKNREIRELESDFEHLKSKYTATKHSIPWESTPLYFILRKLDYENKLSDSEIKWLKHCGYDETIAIAQTIKHFYTLKTKYKATKYQDTFPDSRLYQILKKLDAKEPLRDSDITWLNEHELFETLTVIQEQEAVMESEFAQLKDKYQATKHPNSSVSSPLYLILKNLEADQPLSKSQIDWLEAHQLIETLDIVQQLEQTRHFTELKTKYKASQYEDSSPSSHLYKVLKKLESEHPLGEQDINFLKKRQLTDIITIAQEQYAATLKSKIELGDKLEESEVDWLKNNGRENIIAIAQAKHFATLKSKYNVSDYKDTSPSSPLYAILNKLKKAERLEPKDVAWLQENKIYEWLSLLSGKIAIAYHKIEANFYEQEYQRTGNKWNLPNASSHWRKADKPRQALKLTENLDFDKIKENKLKSALLTTRGGAFRDIEELKKAEKCALKAIEYQPSSHHPYTLMGAICYERREYGKGDYWFEEAIKRGASPRDQDAEIKRVVKTAKDENKRREVVNYLLKKDPQRYAWAKSYLKKSKKKGK